MVRPVGVAQQSARQKNRIRIPVGDNLFGLHRLGMYLMAHALSPYPYLPRVVASYFDTLAQLRPPVLRADALNPAGAVLPADYLPVSALYS